MDKMYQLTGCSTCKRIRAELGEDAKLEVIDIKTTPLTTQELDEFAKRAGSYEQLFSRRAMKYRSLGLAERKLEETDYRQLILDEYTFLKRPVLLIGDGIFVGSAKHTVAAAKQALHE